MPRWVLGLMILSGAGGVGAGVWAYRRRKAMSTVASTALPSPVQEAPRKQLMDQVASVHAEAKGDIIAQQLKAATRMAPPLLPIALSAKNSVEARSVATKAAAVKKAEVAVTQGKAGLQLAAASAAVAQNTVEQMWKAKFG